MAGVDWETAKKHCSLQNDSLVDIQDVQNHLSFLKGLSSIWSSVKGHFTPWIAYRGCFRESGCGLLTGSRLTKTTCHIIQNNTVGNCYFECKSNNHFYAGCANNVNFFFGLQESMCLCLCYNTIIQNISESAKCNISCGTSITNGECGGIGYFSMYESMNVTLPDTHFGGFCLTCRQQSDPSDINLYSIDCNEKAWGHCIMSDGRFPITLSLTFASYWMQCKNHNFYITGTTNRRFCQSNSESWTGLRKYKINNSYIDNHSCYIIEILQDIVSYKEKNCTENRFFLCKHEINVNVEYINNMENTTTSSFTRETSWTTRKTSSQKNLSTRGNTKSHFNITAKNPSSKLKGREATIAGASIAGIIAFTFVVLLVVYVIKRRRRPCLRAKQQANPDSETTNNTTYDDLVVTSQKQDDSNTYTTLSYDKRENDYEHLNDGITA